MTLALSRPDDKQDVLFYSKKDQEGSESGLAAIDVNDQDFLPQLASDSDSRSYSARTSNAADAFNVFKAVADGSDFEWSLSGFKGKGKTQFYLSTEHAKGGVDDLGQSKFNKKDWLFNIHSHPGKDGTKGGSGYYYDYSFEKGKLYLKGGWMEQDYGNPQRQPNLKWYVYHPYTQNLYQYTRKSFAEKNWNSINSVRLKKIIHH
jgi:hypothetical protein